jgi:hypothetical protein
VKENRKSRVCARQQQLRRYTRDYRDYYEKRNRERKEEKREKGNSNSYKNKARCEMMARRNDDDENKRTSIYQRKTPHLFKRKRARVSI